MLIGIWLFLRIYNRHFLTNSFFVGNLLVDCTTFHFELANLSNPHSFTDLLQINILPKGPVSQAFLKRGISDLGQAMEWMKLLPYGRNPDKQNLLSVFDDGCGTCSTKHALIKQLAVEQQVTNLKLFLGIFRMNSSNTPKAAHTLSMHGVDYIPEAHCYLKWKEQILDLTTATSSPADFLPDLIEEMEIQPDQIAGFKISWHKDYLKRWLSESNLPYSPEEIWAIREQCIQDLSKY